MEFDFLPKLPNSDLDDRDFKDLVEECLLRIPRYCPEWTNYNPSDPGITLIELFAWLTDQMRLRFNQVPRRNYVAFLELLGIRLQPPTPAHTELTFYLSQAQPFPVMIPRDTEVATERTTTEEAVVFSTDRNLIIGSPCIKHFLMAETPEEQPTSMQLSNRFQDTLNEDSREWERLEETDLFIASQPGNCFYLVLDTLNTGEAQEIRGNVLELTFRGSLPPEQASIPMSHPGSGRRGTAIAGSTFCAENWMTKPRALTLMSKREVPIFEAWLRLDSAAF